MLAPKVVLRAVVEFFSISIFANAAALQVDNACPSDYCHLETKLAKAVAKIVIFHIHEHSLIKATEPNVGLPSNH